jgi:tripartite-type tricarboxylate transporter receptor subunit TctC
MMTIGTRLLAWAQVGVRAFGVAALLAAAMPGVAGAQDYPNRPIRVIVPLAAGGPGDVVTRAVSDALGAALGQRLVIDNRPGAGSNIGFAAAAAAPPDGYTLLVGLPPLTINPSLFRSVGYDPIRDFAPISRMATFPLVMVANANVPANSLQEFLAYARAHPRELNYGSSGNGSTPHLAGVLLDRLAGTQMTHVPYQGIPAMLTDLLANRIQVAFVAPAAALPLLSQGNLKALTVASASRSPAVPGVPSSTEGGLPGFEMATWYGLLAPAGTPDAIVQRVHDALGRVLRDPATRQRFLDIGAEVAFDETTATFKASLEREVGYWRDILRSINASVD